MADTDTRGGELVPLRPTIDDPEVRLEPPRLDLLTVAQEAEAAELLAALITAAVTRRDAEGALKEAA